MNNHARWLLTAIAIGVLALLVGRSEPETQDSLDSPGALDRRVHRPAEPTIRLGEKQPHPQQPQPAPAADPLRLLRRPGPSKAPAPQIAALERLLRKNPGLEISWRPDQPSPSFLAGQLSEPSHEGPRKIARRFLSKQGALFGIADADNQLRLNVARSMLKPDDCGVRHLRYDQVVHSVPVYQRSLTVHIRANGEIHAVHGRFARGLDEDAIARTPKVAATRVEQAVRKDSGVTGAFTHFTKPQLVVSLLRKRPALCWKSEVIAVRKMLSRTYLINATSGKVEGTVNRVATDYALTTSSTGSGTDVMGNTIPVETTRQSFVDTGLGGSTTTTDHMLWDRTHDAAIITYDYNLSASQGNTCSDGNNSWTTGSQASEISAHHSMGKALYYFERVHNRKSWQTDPNDSSTIRLGSHFLFTRADGTTTPNNASSLGNGYFVFGDGDGTTLRPFVSRDVCGHELTHGIIGSTSGLDGTFESGAIGESFADVMGTFVEKRYPPPGGSNWLMGEEVTMDGTGIRNLANPPSGGDPDHYSEFIVTDVDTDNGGVHTNSCILSKAAFLLTDGGQHPDSRVSVVGIGVYHARVVFYRAMVNYLDANSNFHDVRVAMVAAMSDKIASKGWGSWEKRSVKLAYNACGIYGYNIDIIHYAQYYDTYRTSNGPISFGGWNQSGTVRYFTGALEDGTPSTTDSDSRLAFWPPSGAWKTAKGTYKITLPPVDGSDNPVLRVRVGFAASSPHRYSLRGGGPRISIQAVRELTPQTATVWVTFYPDNDGRPFQWFRTIYTDGSLDTLVQDMSSFAGQTGTLSVGVFNRSTPITRAVVFKELRISYE